MDTTNSNITNRFIDSICYSLILPIEARLHGLWHVVRLHNVSWYDDVDLWIGHLGWITCRDCPDTIQHSDDGKAVSLCILGRHSMIRMKFAQWLCGKLGGHRNFTHPRIWNGQWSNGERVMIEKLDELHCGRCIQSFNELPDNAI